MTAGECEVGQKQPQILRSAQDDNSGKGAIRKLGAVAIVAAGLAILVTIYALGLTPAEATERDYIQYWAAGQQLVHHSDPYDVRAIFAMEKRLGMPDHDAKMSVSPPVALELELPLGWVSAKTGLIVWLVAELIAVLVSIWLLWRLCGRPNSRLHLLGLVFAPVVACQMAGQIGAFFLLCLVLFLVFCDTRPFLAGVVLMPFALKPHLVVPFAVALLVWCLARRKGMLLAGAFAALAASCATSLAIDPGAWSQYRGLTSSLPMIDWRVPTIAFALRSWIHPASRWIGLVPEAVACAWAAWYAWNRRACWDWMEHGHWVMLVSVACAPYSWISDQCVLLPAVLAALLRRPRRRAALALFLELDAIMLWALFRLPSMTSFWYAWTAPAWLAWYFYAMRGNRPSQLTEAVS